MGQLTNQYVSSSYQGLLKMTDSTQGLTNTLQTIQTGDGDNSPLQMSLTEVNISGSFYINNVPITNGTNGTSGTSGSNGTDGSSGTSGSNGTNGTSGSNGTNGSSGSNGTNGSSGTSGSNGTNGSSGTSGGTGSSGTSGSNGSNGSSGTSGSNGTDGSSGTSGDSLFALTGSVWNTTRNIGITGSLFISSSVASDVVINGQLYVSSSSTNSANAPRITVSGSNGITTINRSSITINTTTNYAALNPTITYIGDTATSDELGYTIDPVSYGVSGWTKGPAIYVNDPTDSFPAMIGFQNKANYTNGTVTILNGLDVSGSVNITGQYLVNGVPVSGSGGGDRNGLITTGSITDTQQITGSLILGNTVISGSLVGNTVNGGLIQIRTEASLSGSVPLYITGSNPVSQSNLIFGGSGPTPSFLSGSIVISGSNNIMLQNGRTNTLVTGGSYGYLGSNNIGITYPTLSTASLVSPTVNANNLNAQLNLTFITSSLGVPIISNNLIYGSTTINHPSGSITATSNFINSTNVTSTQTITSGTVMPTLQNNLINGTQFNLNHISSSITTTNNQIFGVATVNNSYFHTGSANSLTFSNNLTNGQGITINAGGNPQTNVARPIVGNLLGGQVITISAAVTGSDLGGLRNSVVYGYNLNVSGSHSTAQTTTQGAAFFGRWNSEADGLADSARTVFAVGTGTATGASRRTAFYITSGSIVGVSGSLLVQGPTTLSGSVNISGSLLLNGVTVGDGNRNGLITTGSAFGTQTITGSLKVITNINIDSGTLNLNNDGQSSIANQGTGRNVMYVDNVYSNFFFGNVPKGQSGRFSGDTGNFIVSPTYAAFETGSNNILLGTSNIGLLSGSNNIRIGGEPNFGSSNYNDTLYIGGSNGVNTNIIQKNGASSPLQLGYSTQVTGSLNVSSLSTSTGSFIVTTDSTGTLTKSPYSAVTSNLFSVGDFYSTQTQTLAAGVSGSVTYNNTGTTYGVSLVSSSQLTIANAGVYSITFSAQIKGDGGQDTVYIWLKKNGTNVADTATKIVAKNNEEDVMTVEYIVQASASDYYELAWQNTTGDGDLVYYAASGNIPAIPSIITSVKQIR